MRMKMKMRMKIKMKMKKCKYRKLNHINNKKIKENIY